MAAVLVEFEVYLLVTCISFIGKYIINMMLYTCAIQLFDNCLVNNMTITKLFICCSKIYLLTYFNISLLLILGQILLTFAAF